LDLQADLPGDGRGVERQVRPHDHDPGTPGGAGGGGGDRDRGEDGGTAREEAALPPRSQVAAITGAQTGVLMWGQYV
jgi:hypothetical protein